MAGSDETAEHQGRLEDGSLTWTGMTQRPDARGTVNRSICRASSCALCSLTVQGLDFFPLSVDAVDTRGPCGPVRSGIASGDPVSEGTQHHFLHILPLRTVTSPARLKWGT